MIVKVQRPLSASEASPPWLVYDRKRSHQVWLAAKDVPTQVREKLGFEHKGYFEASWNHNTKAWVFGERQPQPPGW